MRSSLSRFEMRLVLLALLLAGPAVAQTDFPAPDGPRLPDLASVYAAADDDALPALELAAVTPEAAVAAVWEDALFSASLLASSLQMSSDPAAMPAETALETRPAFRAGIAILAVTASATAGSLVTAAQLHLAHTPPEQRGALQSGLVRDVDALRILLSQTAEEAIGAAFASDDDFDAALVAFGSRGALIQDVVGRLQAATADAP